MLVGKRVCLRPIEREDLEKFVRFFADPEVRPIWTWSWASATPRRSPGLRSSCASPPSSSRSRWTSSRAPKGPV